MTLNKEHFHGRSAVIFVVERGGAGEPPYGETAVDEEGLWLRLGVADRWIVGQFRATPQEAWRTVGSRELPAAGPARIGLHGGYAPRQEQDRSASFSQFRMVQLSRRP